ncbi:MAG: HD domain-containing protein [Oscillospiraceae bacterium]|nr:HD domain-containing protein [Oscillospiraceae bacterium]
MNFTPVNNATGTLEGFCLLKTVEQKTTAKGAVYLDLTIMDTTGEMNAKFWDFRPGVHQFAANDLVKVRGTLSVYNGVDQFRVERIRLVEENDNVRMDDFVPCAPQLGEEMLAEIRTCVEQFSHTKLKELVLAILKDREAQLLYWPGAFRLHHAVRSGLLWHTVAILRMAQAVAALYPTINSDLLFAGVILHDIEKLAEYDVPATGLASGYTLRGNLVGHLVGGAVLLEEYAQKVGLDEETTLLLQHMLISHHGLAEFGAAKPPMFLEAEVLSQLDLLDARMHQMETALQGVQPGEYTNKIWALDNRKFYKPRG